LEEITKNNTDELSEENVWNILEFASSFGGYGYNNIMTPMLLNQRMKDLNLNPLAATEQSLNDALIDPKNSELALQSFSEDFESKSQIYKRLLSYLQNLLAFDMNYTCINAKTGDYSGKSYQRDKDKISEFFDKFDYKKEFNIAVGEMLRNETFFFCPRWDMDQIVLQELPASPNYTMITGRWSYGFLFSMSAYWFILPGVDINLYPNFFIKKYNELCGNNNALQTYDPSLSPQARGNSSWVFWMDIPVDVGHVFKLNPALSTRIPYFTGLFSDLVNQSIMRSLQKNINMSAASRIIIGEVGQLKDAAAKLKDAFNISPALLGNFLALVKSSIGDAVKTAALPLNNVKSINFPAENELYSSYLKTSVAMSGVNSNLIFSNDLKMNAVETQLSLGVDIQLMENIYPQMAAFLNYHVNRFTDKFKFKFSLEGSNFYTDRQQRFDKQMELSALGMVLPQKIAASLGMSPFDFQRQLDEGRETGFTDKLTPIISAFQQGSKDVGRPQKNDTTLSDEGSETRGQGSNIDKGGKI